jgi:hypothetical protein
VEEIASDADGVTIGLTRTEFRIVNNSLNEVTNLIGIPDTDFVPRLGGTRSEIAQLLDRIRGSVETSVLPPGRRPGQAVGPDEMTVCLGLAELKLLRNAMIEMTKGEEIEEWDYPIRLGATVAEGRQLLAEVENLIGRAAA